METSYREDCLVCIPESEAQCIICTDALVAKLNRELAANAEDIPELVYPQYLMAVEPPEDQYEMMIEVDQWAAKQAIDDTDLKQHGLAWLALSEQARIEHCEAYWGACEDRNQVRGRNDGRL